MFSGFSILNLSIPFTLYLPSTLLHKKVSITSSKETFGPGKIVNYNHFSLQAK